ncbi:hypothetical protein NQ314_014982 [Rhamnusium bicolor]|uniref:Integrase p58-like C-terminal domain-containing protein n=1 Tax=Rhamnusium bicolor TaxID=1586634 RepID=A0AAV8WZV1_9CUCU|nr:hypothetical protein NQ314_014982 [Rhamnusium bicolor]
MGPVNYKIRKVHGRDEQVVHVNRLKKYYEKEKQLDGTEDEDNREEALNESDEEDEEKQESTLKLPLIPQWIEIPVNIRDKEDSEEDIKDEPTPRHYLSFGQGNAVLLGLRDKNKGIYGWYALITGESLYRTIGGGIVLLACLWNNLTMWVIHHHHERSAETRRDNEMRGNKIDNNDLKTVVSNISDAPINTSISSGLGLYPTIREEPHWTETEVQSRGD